MHLQLIAYFGLQLMPDLCDLVTIRVAVFRGTIANRFIIIDAMRPWSIKYMFGIPATAVDSDSPVSHRVPLGGNFRESKFLNPLVWLSG